MKMAGAVGLVLLAAAIIAGCDQGDSAARVDSLGKTREAQMLARLAKADVSGDTTTPVAIWIMPPELREISGLTLMADGNLLTHEDEFGRVFVVDPRRGMVLKQFTLGEGTAGDFESITTDGPDIYMLTSHGVLYQFREGDDETQVRFTETNLHLDKQCEIESMVYQRDSNWLVMPCKNAYDAALKNYLVIYRWRLTGPVPAKLSKVLIPFSKLVGQNTWKHLHPSDITIDPSSGNFVMVASKEQALIEFTSDGRLTRNLLQSLYTDGTRLQRRTPFNDAQPLRTFPAPHFDCGHRDCCSRQFAASFKRADDGRHDNRARQRHHRGWPRLRRRQLSPNDARRQLP